MNYGPVGIYPSDLILALRPLSMGLPGGAVIVKDADDNNLLEKPVTLLLAERVNTDSLSRWRRNHDREFFALAGADLFHTGKLAPAQLFAGRGV